MTLKSLSIVMASVLTIACQTTPTRETPAILYEPATDCIAQMEQFASEQTKRKVTLTPLAFSQSDALLLEQALHRGPDGRPLDGRMLTRPEVFKLLRGDSQCVMLSTVSNERKTLDACSCKAYTQPSAK